jgi:hypothetical protein
LTNKKKIKKNGVWQERVFFLSSHTTQADLLAPEGAMEVCTP